MKSEEKFNTILKKLKKGLKVLGKLLKKPKVLLAIGLAWYIETPLVILAEQGILNTNLMDLYINPFKIFIKFITSFSVICGLIKLNLFFFIIFVIICVVLHISGHETEKLLDFNKLKILSDLLQKEEGEITYSNRGDYGTSRWADEKFIDKMNRESVASKSDVYIEISKEGKNGLVYGYFEDTKKIITLPKKTTLNRNFAVFGSSGSMKSRSFVIPNILNLIDNEESIFVTDPKGELLAKTYDVLVENGYNVKAFNINNIPCSDRWNVLKEIRDEQTASIFAKSIIDNTKGQGEKGDPFWDNHYVNFLKAIALYVRYNEPEERQNMATVYEYITYPQGFTGLDELIGSVIKKEKNHPAAQSWIAFTTAAGNEKVAAGVMSGLAIKLDTLQIPSFRDLLSGNDIDLTAPGREKCAYFVVVPDTHGTFNFLAGLFFTFAFINLIDFADKLGESLPYHVNFLLDEFPNIAKIPDIEKKISTVRSRGVSICIIFQALSQLASRYSPEIAEEILANCDNKIFLGANEMTTSKYISEMLGDATIEVQTEMKERHKFLPSRSSKGLAKRNLMTPDEVLKKPKKNSILLLTGMRPIKATKMDYTQHRNGDKIHEHNIYDMLKPWSEKYHEHYLEEMCKQLRKAINKDEIINDIDTSNIGSRTIDEMESEVVARSVSSAKNEEEKSKMEKTLILLEEKLRILREEKERKKYWISNEIGNCYKKLNANENSIEILEEIKDIIDKLRKEILTEEEQKSLDDLTQVLNDKFDKITASNIANKVQEIMKNLNSCDFEYSSEEDFEKLTSIVENMDIHELKDIQKNKIYDLIEEIVTKYAIKGIKSNIKSENFDIANKSIQYLFEILESSIIKECITTERPKEKEITALKEKIIKLEFDYNKASEKAFYKKKELESFIDNLDDLEEKINKNNPSSINLDNVEKDEKNNITNIINDYYEILSDSRYEDIEILEDIQKNVENLKKNNKLLSTEDNRSINNLLEIVNIHLERIYKDKAENISNIEENFKDELPFDNEIESYTKSLPFDEDEIEGFSDELLDEVPNEVNLDSFFDELNFIDEEYNANISESTTIKLENNIENTNKGKNDKIIIDKMNSNEKKGKLSYNNNIKEVEENKLPDTMNQIEPKKTSAAKTTSINQDDSTSSIKTNDSTAESCW